MKNPDLSVKILLPKCQTEIMEKLVLEDVIFQYFSRHI